MLQHTHVTSAVKPLRYIFWGGILWICDLTFTTTTNGSGFRFDVLDDTVGTLLIAVGIFRLAAAPVGGRYGPVMSFLNVAAVASVISTAVHHFVFEKPVPLVVAENLLSIGQLVATVLFCVAMRWFRVAAGLRRPAGSWHVTFLLFLLIYVFPLGFLYAASLVALASGRSFHVDVGPAGLILVPVFAIPLVHLFVSTSRMRAPPRPERPCPPPEASR